MAAEPFQLTVFGKPQPAGSKRAFMRPGMRHPSVVDDNAKSGDWKKTVAHFAGEKMRGREKLTGPLVASFTFTVSRPKGHFGSGKNAAELKPGAPSAPTTRPDALKLARAVEDSLSLIVYDDDAQIVEEHLHKIYGEFPGVYIEIQAWSSEP